MDDDETHKLILRLQMEDLTAIWASSTTSTEDGTKVDADVSLRLYRHELRTANQQIDDRISARAAAEDEIRQRDALSADREEARRLFQQLNPDEPVPELSQTGQPVSTGHPIPCNALIQNGTSSVSAPLQRFGQPDMRTSSSPSSRQTIVQMPGLKRSADHLDTLNGPASKKHASERTIIAASQVERLWGLDPERTHFGFGPSAPVKPDMPARSFTSSPYTIGSVKRPAEAEDVTPPPAKRQETLSKTSPFAFTPSSYAARETKAPANSGPTTTSKIEDPVFALFGRPSSVTTATPLSVRGTILKRGSSRRSPFPPKASRNSNRTSSTDDVETPVSQVIPASKQPVASGHQLAIESDQPSEIECVACCREVPRSKSYSNSCGHAYCAKCVNRLLKKAVHDDSLWPPQCCKAEFSLENFKSLLREDLVPLVEARQIEMSVGILDRIYCVGCSTFIPGDSVQGKNATCPACMMTMCTECKEETHVGGCQNKLEQDIKDLEALAQKEGWKKCSNCLMIVEHNTGCNHMT